MIPNKKRIIELENRVSELEAIVCKLQDVIYKKDLETDNENIQPDKYIKQSITYEKPNNKRQRFNKDIQKESKSKLSEVMVGRYIVGALASLLIFVGAISLIALYWAKMTDEIKLSLLVISGLILTATGFFRVKKHRDTITDIILGTGSGLLFISIMTANMAFKFISSNTAFLLAGVWSLFYIAAYKYTQRFFTTIIAYIGTIISIVMGLTLVKTDIDFLIVLIFTITIGVSMLISSKRWQDNKEQLICSLMTMVSIIILALGFTILAQTLNVASIQMWTIYYGIILIYMHGVLNILYYLCNILKTIPIIYILGSVLVILTTIISALLGFNHGLDYGYKSSLILIIGILIVQFTINEWKSYLSRKILIYVYTIFISFNLILLNLELFDFALGISIAALYLQIIDRIKGRNEYSFISSILILIDSVILLIMGDCCLNGNELIYLIYVIIQVALATYILFNHYKIKETKNIIFIKIICLISYMFSTFFLTANILRPVIENSKHVSAIPISYFATTVLLVILTSAGYFKNWFNPAFKWFKKGDLVPEDKSSYSMYVFTTLLYFMGLAGLYNVDILVDNLLIILSLLSLALIQTINILRYHKNNKFIGAWIGIKYLIFAWAVLTAKYDIEFESVILSITGLAIALGSIAWGFSIKVKSLRLYGLILTILMVIKFIVIDLSQGNSIIRVVSLVLGGLICFGISVLYIKLESKL